MRCQRNDESGRESYECVWARACVCVCERDSLFPHFVLNAWYEDEHTNSNSKRISISLGAHAMWYIIKSLESHTSIESHEKFPQTKWWISEIREIRQWVCVAEWRIMYNQTTEKGMRQRERKREKTIFVFTFKCHQLHLADLNITVFTLRGPMHIYTVKHIHAIKLRSRTAHKNKQRAHWAYIWICWVKFRHSIRVQQLK